MNKRRLYEGVGGEVSDLVTDDRKQRIESVLAKRTSQIIPVFECPYDLGNVAAVLRSAEGLGFQEAHLVVAARGMRVSPRRTSGAHKWMDVVRWKGTTEAFESLRSRGYRIAVTCFEGATSIEKTDFTVPTAVVFGNEREGASKEAIEGADIRLCIPMYGFTSSFNVSVAAAILLYEARRQWTEAQGPGPTPLEPERIDQLRDHYYWLSSALSR